MTYQVIGNRQRFTLQDYMATALQMYPHYIVTPTEQLFPDCGKKKKHAASLMALEMFEHLHGANSSEARLLMPVWIDHLS